MGVIAMDKDSNLPIDRKYLLSIPEAAEYTNIGQNKINELLKEPRCSFVLFVGKKKLVKRTEFENWLSDQIEL